MTYLENVVIVVLLFDVGFIDDFNQLRVREREPVASVQVIVLRAPHLKDGDTGEIEPGRRRRTTHYRAR
jgi:hypothetical protein